MSDDEWVELTGDDIPYHLRLDAPALARCTRCKRHTWAADAVGEACGMPQPDGSVCRGRFEAHTETGGTA